MTMISLAQAIREGRVADFIRQEEVRGISADHSEFEEALRRVITSPQGSRPASRSPDRDGSRGK